MLSPAGCCPAAALSAVSCQQDRAVPFIALKSSLKSRCGANRAPVRHIVKRYEYIVKRYELDRLFDESDIDRPGTKGILGAATLQIAGRYPGSTWPMLRLNRAPG